MPGFQPTTLHLWHIRTPYDHHIRSIFGARYTLELRPVGETMSRSPKPVKEIKRRWCCPIALSRNNERAVGFRAQRAGYLLTGSGTPSAQIYAYILLPEVVHVASYHTNWYRQIIFKNRFSIGGFRFEGRIKIVLGDGEDRWCD
jgi:hypothetical protein